MATRTAKSKASNGQQEQSARFGSVSANELVPVRGSVSSEGRGTYWGDRLAFKIWLIGFLLMALMVAYDAITGLLRGTGH